MPRLESPAHVQQTAAGHCLPACAQMALAQLGVASTQEQLARALGTRVGVGTPFSRVTCLAQWSVRVRLVQPASLDELRAALASGKAVIVAVTTTPGLPGWGNVRTQHTLLLVGSSGAKAVYHDPAMSRGPVSVLLDEFLLAWDEMGAQAAFLGLKGE